VSAEVHVTTERPIVLIEGLERLCATWIAPQMARLRSRAVIAKPKVFNDNLWGTIRLHAWEVALVDTYLFQRLRLIRQLGVIHWVYQSASHSRFEHSLGVVHQMQGLIDGIERNSSRAGEPVIDDYTTYILRLAALLHDIGHAAMSHVSDPILARFPDAKRLASWTRREYSGRKEPSVTESVAAVFIRSPAFREFLALREVGADFIRDVEATTRELAGLIVGGAVRPNAAFLSLLLNGAFDADKLDYMPRDCLMAGVPSAVDVDRMVEKVQVLDVPTALLQDIAPDYLSWGDQEANTETVRVLALSSAGKGALHELAETRTVLFRKVYHHQKVRGLEVMVRRLMVAIIEQNSIASLTQWLDLVDADIFRHEHPIAKQLRERYLLKRAFEIEVPGDPKTKVTIDGKVQTKRRGWLQLRQDFSDGTLRDKILVAAREAAELLGAGVNELADLESEVDLMDRTGYSLDQFAFVGDGVNDFAVSDTVEGGERSESTKRLTIPNGHVFAPEGAILPTFFASLVIMARDYGLSSEPYCHTITKLDPDAVIAAARTLNECGYFDELPGNPPDLKPARIVSHREAALESFLKAAWPRIQRVGIEFGRYVSLDADPISPARVASYLRQFGDESLARPALRLLESIKLRGRNYLKDALRSRLTYARGQGDIACVVPLGATGDSSTLLSYLMNDLPLEERKEVLSIEVALQRYRGQRILLWDDFCGSGRHTKTVLCQWLGLPDDSDEDLVPRLSDDLVKVFTNQEIALTFAAGMEAGRKMVRQFCDANGLAKLDTWPPAEPVPAVDPVFDNSQTIHDEAERADLRVFLQDKAREIFAPRQFRSHKPWSPEKIENRLLGFDNACQRIVFFYNVPTVTLTALWEQADDPQVWTPLFRRRTKPSRIVGQK
jgi:HD superfamily phosphohydrolase